MNRMEYPKFLRASPLILGMSFECIVIIAVGMVVSGNIFRFGEKFLLIQSVLIWAVMSGYQKFFKRNAFYFYLTSLKELNWKFSMRRSVSKSRQHKEVL